MSQLPVQPFPFHGLIGSGLIGRDPFDKRSYSGSSYYFFTECQRQGLLSGASGVELGGWRKWLLLAASFHPSKERLRLSYYLRPAYRDALTRLLEQKLRPTSPGRTLLQIGALYSGPEIQSQGGYCTSYHDGNLALRLRSPYGRLLVSDNLVEKAMAYERRLYHRLDLILTMSEYLRRSFIDDFGVRPNRVVNIGAGANLDELPEVVPVETRKGQGILFIGADFERKGGRVLLEAFAGVRRQLPEAELHIVGPRQGPPEGLPLERVVWHGFLDKSSPDGAAKMKQLLSECRVLALPSLYEPFGIAPVEAMLHGMPAVVTGDWALGETVTHEVNGLHVRAGDATSLKEALLRMLSEPGLDARLGINAVSHAREHFTWPQVVNKLRAAIEVMATSPALNSADPG
jgi:glycosyltransferase involved in cell wall biosynthesis